MSDDQHAFNGSNAISDRLKVFRESMVCIVPMMKLSGATMTVIHFNWRLDSLG
jgi:hypothetical protein